MSDPLPNPESAGFESDEPDTAKWWEKLPRADWARYERVHPEVAWFEIYLVAPETYALYEPGHFEEKISFLIVGTDRALLFDTGLGLHPIRPVVELLTDKSLIVISSHSHYDHIGGNHEFDTITGLDNPFTAHGAKGLSNAEIGDFVKNDWLPKPPSADFDPKTYQILPWKRGDIIKDGQIIDLGGRKIEVLETPGHAPDEVCLLDRDTRLLFMGDLFYLSALYANLEESDFATYKASVDRLAAFEQEVDYLMTPHNVPKVNATYLSKLKEAFQAVEEKSAPSVEINGALEYKFDGFSVIVPVE